MENTPHFAYDDQIASQPNAVRKALEHTRVPALDPNRPLLFTGIGTSLHACRVAAAWVSELSQGKLRPAAIEAHELALRGQIRPEAQVVVVSHRGTKRYPNAVLAKAKAAGARTVTVTSLDAHPDAEVVLRTCPNEAASTHTVSYTSALAVLGLLVARMLGEEGRGLEQSLQEVPEALEKTLAYPAPTAAAAELVGKAMLFLTGFGLDAITAEEAALKIKEGAYLWAEGMSVEFSLHGTPAVFSPEMGAILIAPAFDDGGRTEALRELLEELSVRTLNCAEAGDLPFARTHPLVRPLVAIAPLQRLVAELARLRGANPDRTHAEAELWGSAIAAVGL
jgi:glucosamine--fructose-6-phosphate aminotransferase (isomerizing)